MAAASNLEPFVGKSHSLEHDIHKHNNIGGPKLAGLWPELKNQSLVHLSKELAEIGFAIQNGRNRLQQKTPRAVASTFKNKHLFLFRDTIRFFGSQKVVFWFAPTGDSRRQFWSGCWKIYTQIHSCAKTYHYLRL